MNRFASDSMRSFNLNLKNYLIMDISVIIVNYNVKEYIISCIESINKHTDDKYKFEIIVTIIIQKMEVVTKLKTFV